MKTLGIDQSLNTCGYCVLENTTIKTIGRVKTSGTQVEKLIQLREFFHGLYEMETPDIVAREGFSFASKGSSIYIMGAVGYVLDMVFYELGAKYYKVVPSRIKKYVTGRGNSRKEEMLLYAFKKFGQEFKNNDECDAYCIARYLQDCTNDLNEGDSVEM